MTTRRTRQARYDRAAPNGPASEAGQRGVENYERVVRDLKPGDAAQVKLIRGTTEMVVPVTVGGV